MKLHVLSNTNSPVRLRKSLNLKTIFYQIGNTICVVNELNRKNIKYHSMAQK